MDKNINDKLLSLGLNYVFNKYDETSIEVIKEITKICPKIIQANLHNLSVSVQMRMMEDTLNNNPDNLKEAFWVDYVQKALNNFNEQSDAYYYVNGIWYVILNRIKDISEEVDWFEVLIKLGKGAIAESKITPGFIKVLDWLIVADIKNLVKLVHRTETKSYPRELKVILYEKIISEGLLDVKIARRIRSDSSGALSREILSSLFEHRQQYTDDNFNNLIMQFNDTKHRWVARFIALNMPFELMSFLFGLDDSGAMKIIENRMEAKEG